MESIENSKIPKVERLLEDIDITLTYENENGFTTTPNGSFWDDNGAYFNHWGYDIHGGHYDKFGLYIPGPNFNGNYFNYCDNQDNLDDEQKDLIITQLKNEVDDEYPDEFNITDTYSQNQANCSSEKNLDNPQVPCPSFNNSSSKVNL